MSKIIEWQADIHEHSEAFFLKNFQQHEAQESKKVTYEIVTVFKHVQRVFLTEADLNISDVKLI